MKKISLSLMVVCAIIFLAGGARGDFDDFEYDFTFATKIESNLTVPTELKIQNSNVLTWKGVSNAESYHIYQYQGIVPNSGDYTLIGETSSTSYNISAGLEKGKLYYFKVKAVNKCGETELSDFQSWMGFPEGTKLQLSAVTPVMIGNGESTSEIKVKLVTKDGQVLSWISDGQVTFSASEGWLSFESDNIIGGEAETTLTSPLKSWSSGEDPSKTTSLTIRASVPGLPEVTTTVEIIKNVEYPVEVNTVSEAEDFLTKRKTALNKAVNDAAASKELKEIVQPSINEINQWKTSYANVVTDVNDWLYFNAITAPSLEASISGLEEKATALNTAIDAFNKNPASYQLFNDVLAQAEAIEDAYNLDTIVTDFEIAYATIDTLYQKNNENAIMLALNNAYEVTACAYAAPARHAAGELGKLMNTVRKVSNWVTLVKDIRTLIQHIKELANLRETELNRILNEEVLDTIKPTEMIDTTEENIRNRFDFVKKAEKKHGETKTRVGSGYNHYTKKQEEEMRFWTWSTKSGDDFRKTGWIKALNKIGEITQDLVKIGYDLGKIVICK